MSRHVATAAAIALLTIVVFLPSLGYPFLGYDDNEYVTENPRVTEGLSVDGVRWSLTSFAVSNWHPLTWLSYMLDVSLFGVRPGPMRAVNVLLHAASAATLFLLVLSLAESRGAAAFVAAVFAVHPLRVESVVWISERKDVLCVFFSLLTVAAYVRYARKPTPAGYALVVVGLVAALLSKPMAVTLPALLILLDAGPLRRQTASRMRAVADKFPLFAVAGAVAAVTVLVQRRWGSMKFIETTFAERLSNAIVSTAAYVGDFLWPSGLAVFYPFPETPRSASVVAACAAGAAIVTAVAVLRRSRHPWLLTGWAWYLVALLPVLGLLQVGGQARADRYTYLPSIGLGVLVAGAGAEVVRRGLLARRAAGVLAGVAVLALAAANLAQQRHWVSDVALFRRAVAVSPDAYLAHHNLAMALAGEGNVVEAEAHHREAVRAGKRFAEAGTFRRALGDLLVRTGRPGEAATWYRDAVALDAADVEAWNSLAICLARTGDLDGAVAAYEAAVAAVPADGKLRENLAAARAIRDRVRSGLERPPGP